MIDLNNYLAPDEDLVASAIEVLKQITSNVLSANDKDNMEFPQMIVGIQNEVEVNQFRNADKQRFTLKIDIFVDQDEEFTGMRMRAVAKKLLKKLQLEQYATRYIPGTLSSPTLIDTSTSRPLWHGVILLDFEMIFMKEG